MIKNAQVKTSARRHWMAINRDVLKSDGKALKVDEEVLKGNEKAIKDNEKALKGNEEAYYREMRRR